MREPDDQTYLKDVQYRDGSHLSARARLHELYSTSRVKWFDFVASLVDWPATTEVLEVGCGTGLVWSAIDAALTRPVRVTLTDLSEGMLAEAVARVRDLQNIEVTDACVADAQWLPFESESFDVVLANHMLYHVPDRALAVREIRRVLRPEGRLVAATNGMGHMRELDALDPDANAEKHSAAFGRENGARILSQAFGDVAWHSHDDTLRCTNAADVVAYAVSMAPDRMTDDRAAELRTKIGSVMAANGGVFAITKDTGAFVASQ